MTRFTLIDISAHMSKVERSVLSPSSNLTTSWTVLAASENSADPFMDQRVIIAVSRDYVDAVIAKQ